MSEHWRGSPIRLSSNIITIPVLFFGGVALAFSMDSTLALIILLAMPVITLMVLAIGRRVEPLWKISDRFCDKQNDLVRERLHGIRVIRAFNREEQEQNRIAEATRVMADHIIEANTKMGLVAPIAIALMNLVAVAVLYFGGSRMQSGISGASAGDIFAMVQYVALVMNGIVMAAFALVMYPHAKVAADRIGEVMDADMMTETTKENMTEDITFAGDIRMENVTFRYEDADAAAVSDISLHIAAGQKIAVIGGTGSGKSTLVQLLMAFRLPTEGKIYFDGRTLLPSAAAPFGRISAVFCSVPVFTAVPFVKILPWVNPAPPMRRSWRLPRRHRWRIISRRSRRTGSPAGAGRQEPFRWTEAAGQHSPCHLEKCTDLSF